MNLRLQNNTKAGRERSVMKEDTLSKTWTSGLLCVLCFSLCLIPSIQAAEIRLKTGTVQTSEPLITLADVADVLPMNNEDVTPLRNTVLFQAPAAGTERTLDQWELRTILSQLGVTSIHHLIVGAPRVTVSSTVPALTPSGTDDTAPSNLRNGFGDSVSPASLNEGFVIQAALQKPANPNTVTPIDAHIEPAPKNADITEDIARLLERQVAQALNVYLNFTHRLERSWDISLRLTPDQMTLLATSGQIAEITSGQIPFTESQHGTQQQFQIRMQNNVSIAVEAVIALPKEVVVVRRALPRGYIINESDVMMQRADNVRNDDFFVDIKSVVGMETLKSVRELSPLTQSDIRKPLWVRKGEIVTVRAVNGGITVRTEATALQDGVDGDTITVAKIDLAPRRGKREAPTTYLVRVCAPKTAEVLVQ